MTLKIDEYGVYVSNSLDPGETPSYVIHVHYTCTPVTLNHESFYSTWPR